MAYGWTGYSRKPYYGRYGNYWRKGWRRPKAAGRRWRQQSETNTTEDLEPSTKRLDIPRNRFGSTRSGVVKLSVQSMYTLQQPVESLFYSRAFKFSMNEIPGFSDYKSVYSRFRIIRGEVVIPTLASSSTTSTSNNYLVVSSQPFAETNEDAGTGIEWVPDLPEQALRQARWQRTVYPDSTTTGIRFGFRPYTMISTYGPQTGTERTWQRVWRGYNWTPFTWVTSEGLYYYGPYILRSPTDDDQTEVWQATITIILYVQFAGQR